MLCFRSKQCNFKENKANSTKKTNKETKNIRDRGSNGGGLLSLFIVSILVSDCNYHNKPAWHWPFAYRNSNSK